MRQLSLERNPLDEETLLCLHEHAAYYKFLSLDDEQVKKLQGICITNYDPTAEAICCPEELPDTFRTGFCELFDQTNEGYCKLIPGARLKGGVENRRGKKLVVGFASSSGTPEWINIFAALYQGTNQPYKFSRSEKRFITDVYKSEHEQDPMFQYRAWRDRAYRDLWLDYDFDIADQ